MRLFFLILFALGVGAALGHFGPGLVRGADETEFRFPAPDQIQNTLSRLGQVNHTPAIHWRR
jgi:hypothetical protein